MVRLMALALLAGPAGAACFGPGVPRTVHFDSGRTIEILGHTAQDVTYRSLLPDGAPAVATLRNGLFLQTASNHGTTYFYEWQGALPGPDDLVPGFAGHFEADMVVEHAHRTFVAMDVKVLRTDHLTVAGCDYPVSVIDWTDQRDGKVAARMTLWFAPSLRVALRNEVTQDGVTTVHDVVALE